MLLGKGRGGQGLPITDEYLLVRQKGEASRHELKEDKKSEVVPDNA